MYKCKPVSENDYISIPVYFLDACFIYDNMMIYVNEDGILGTRCGGNAFPLWTTEIRYLPPEIHQAAVMWRKSGNLMPIHEFLNEIFGL
jgi:hypothetical protein